MKLVTELAEACKEASCPPATTVAFGATQATTVVDPLVGADDPVAADGDGWLIVLVLGLVAGALLGMQLQSRFAERFGRLRTRYRTAEQLRSALVPVIAGLRRAEKQENPALVAEALRADGGRIGACIDVLAPLVSPSRAERFRRHLGELEDYLAPAAAKPLDPQVVLPARKALEALLRSSYL